MKAENYEEYNEKKYEENYWQVDRSGNKWFSKYVKERVIGRWIKNMKSRGVLLDAGGGVGNWAAYFKKYFKKTIVLDVSRLALKSIPEKDIIKKQGSVLDIPIESNSADCVILIDVFEHLLEKDLDKMLAELGRVLKSDGRIIIFTSQMGYGAGIFWKMITKNKNRLTDGDLSEGHLNRLTFSEFNKLIRRNNLKIEDYYHYSIIFQQATDFFKDSFARIASRILGKKDEGKRTGQSIKEGARKIENNTLIGGMLLLFSIISYIDIVLFGKIIPGTSIFLNLRKIQ